MLPQNQESHRDTLNRISDLIETLIRQSIPELSLYPDERVKVISFTIATKTYKAITGREYSLNDPVQAVGIEGEKLVSSAQLILYIIVEPLLPDSRRNKPAS